MGGQAVGRSGGRLRWALGIGAAASLSVSSTVRLTAQVGHDPGHSPFHDVPHGLTLRFETGYLAGGRGTVPVGISGGPTFGLRLETQLSHVLSLSTGLAYGQTTRNVAFPFDSAARRLRGPVDCDIVLADLGFQIGLTGAKTFHGFQPYVGTGLGIAAGSKLPADTSGFQAGTKLSLMGGAGLRWYPARRLSVQAEARAIYWKLTYPFSFREPAPDDGSSLLGITSPLTDGVTHSWLSIGVGWIF
jgi:opacity protein-like surface antigen